MDNLFSSINLKRVLAIVGTLAVLTVTISIYKENTTFDFNDGTNFFKKYYLPNAGGIKKLMKFKYECSHSKIIEEEKKLEQPEQAYDPTLQGRDDVSDILSVEQEYKPIRITADFANVSGTIPLTNTFLSKSIIPAILGFFQEAVKVQRLTSPLIVDPFYKKKPCGAGKVTIATHFTTGVPDTDLLLYVKTFVDDKSPLAYSSHCPQEKNFGLASGRPTVIYLNINLKTLEEDLKSKDPMILAKWIYICLHEMTHSLAFSPNYFDKYLLEPNPVKIINYRSVVVAPSVVKVGKEHFNCQTLTGLPLEDEGDAETLGAHWDRKAFGNELMTGTPMYDSVFSKFTSAMFTASGWYKMNDYMTGTLTWGFNEKCDFIPNGCPTNSLEFCTSYDNHCSYDFTGSGTCQSDKLSNKCKFWDSNPNAHCTFPDANNQKIFKSNGGGFGPNARCFETNLAKSAGFKDVSSLCFESKCEFSQKGTLIKFKVFDKEYTCDMNTPSVTIPSKGVVQCPDVMRFCFSSSACPNSCTGRGVCRLGKCQCYNGFKGEDCSTTL